MMGTSRLTTHVHHAIGIGMYGNLTTTDSHYLVPKTYR